MNRVIAVTATHRRPAQLAALLASLESERPVLAGAVIVDNAAEPETEAIAARASFPVRVITPGKNLGCGGGVALGLCETWRDADATHAWLFDDDAAATPGALAALLTALEVAGAEAAVPLIRDTAGDLGWFPGPLPQPAWEVVRRPKITPEEMRAACGTAPLPWSWAPWPSLLVTGRAIEAVGLPRDDYWFQGEDIEFTLRLSARFRCVLAPAALCAHYVDPSLPGRGTFLKKCAFLQNNAYTFLRLPHGRRARVHLPGNIWRFLRDGGMRPATWVAAGQALWRGAVRGRPAGTPGFDQFHQAWRKIVKS